MTDPLQCRTKRPRQSSRRLISSDQINTTHQYQIRRDSLTTAGSAPLVAAARSAAFSVVAVRSARAATALLGCGGAAAATVGEAGLNACAAAKPPISTAVAAAIGYPVLFPAAALEMGSRRGCESASTTLGRGRAEEAELVRCTVHALRRARVLLVLIFRRAGAASVGRVFIRRKRRGRWRRARVPGARARSTGCVQSLSLNAPREPELASLAHSGCWRARRSSRPRCQWVQ
jgi:hypothetical protein